MTDETREMRRVRALFISDVHLGMRPTRVAQLIDFLRWHDADVMYLVGDIVDGWRLSKSWHWPTEYNQLAQLLLEAGFRHSQLCMAHVEGFLQRKPE